ncbi:hypothetical protein PspLS_10964 [Pyricularia sp. CBS 133598]|nr:hypothetical protein PspLS_10964 [Pyricularia sp. CBS 133598]
MQIFKIVQVLGLLTVGTSALPTPATVDAALPFEGGQLQARTESGSPAGNKANADPLRSSSIKCLNCQQDGFPTVDEYTEHYKQKHPEDLQQPYSPNPYFKGKETN